MKQVTWLMIVLGVIPGCGVEAASNHAGYATYSQGGSVWIDSACPNTDHALSGNPDGLPSIEDIQTREDIETWLEPVGNARVIARNGEAWDRDADGTIFTVQVEDYIVEITLRDASECPESPVFMNGVPVIYRLTRHS